jgi:predicted permease
MIEIFFKIFGMFLVVITGFILKERNFLDLGSWQNFEKLSYFLLVPVLVFSLLSKVEFDEIVTSSTIVLYVYATIACAILVYIVIALCWRNNSFANKPCDLQALIRFNNFIGITTVMIIFDDEALRLYSTVIPAVILYVNTVCAVVLQKYHTFGQAVRVIAKGVITNPIVLASLLGIIWSYLSSKLDLQIPTIIHTWIAIIAKSALGVGLLCLGAALCRGHINLRGSASIITVIIIKMLLTPLLVVSLLYYKIIDFSSLSVTSYYSTATLSIFMVMFSALPDATTSVVQARRTGHNAEYAAALTITSTLVSALTLPLWIYVATKLFTPH